MPLKEATFWWGTIVGGTGIYFWVEGGNRMTTGIILTVVGALMSAYAVAGTSLRATPEIKTLVNGLRANYAPFGLRRLRPSFRANQFHKALIVVPSTPSHHSQCWSGLPCTRKVTKDRYDCGRGCR